MILRQLPSPNPGDRVTFMGNTGEGKSVLAGTLLLAQPDAIILNTKGDPFWDQVGERIEKDADIYHIEEGRWNFCPTIEWQHDLAEQERFFAWLLKAGNRTVYIDELNDICPNAKTYPLGLQRCVKQGRWKKLSIWGSAQEPIRCPSFFFGQSQHRYLFYLGWDPHRKMAEAWFQEPIPWEQLPERSGKFFLKTPGGTYGPQPRLKTPLI